MCKSRLFDLGNLAYLCRVAASLGPLRLRKTYTRVSGAICAVAPCLLAPLLASMLVQPAWGQSAFGPARLVEFGGSTRLNAASSSVSSDGLQLYYTDSAFNTRVSSRADLEAGFDLGRNVVSGIHPEISRDGLELYTNNDPGPFGAGDIRVNKRSYVSDAFGPVEWLGSGVNTAAWERWASVSGDGLELYFTRSERYESATTIWVASRINAVDPFENAVALPAPINRASGYDEAADISADGLTLYFSSDRPGGFGGMDLWAVTRPALDGPWGEPFNLGASINTAGAEWQPDIAADGKTMYFTRSPSHFQNVDYKLWEARVIPEPSAAALAIGGACSSLFGLRRLRSQRRG